MGNIIDAITNRRSVYKNMERNLIWVKFYGVLLLIAMAVVAWKKNIGFMRSSPIAFSLETLSFAVTSVLAYLLLNRLRSKDGTPSIKIMVIIFVAFAFINVLLELNGIYALGFNSPDSSVVAGSTPVYPTQFPTQIYSISDTAVKASSLVLIIAFAIPLLFIILSVFLVHDYDPLYTRFNDPPTIKGVTFLIEALLFGIINACPIFLMAKDRDKLNKTTFVDFFIIMAKFIGIHIVLQLSGFYNAMFNDRDTFMEHIK